MALTKFFRVAIEGETVDGRKVDADTIDQMAADYDPQTYTAVVNCEHLRGFSPEPPFNSYGHVVALRAQDDDIRLGPKTEKRRALYAQLDVNDQAKAVNQAGQKKFSSIEIHPKLTETGRPYLLGFAITDNPAMLATQVLKFSRDEKKKDNLIAVSEPFEIEFEEEKSASEVTSAFSAMREFFQSFTARKSNEPAVPPQPAAAPEAPGQPDQFAAFSAAMIEGLGKIESAFKASNDANTEKFAKITQDMAALTDTIENTKSQNYRQRPTATGGGDRVRAVC